jgi:hypothetical protein
LALLRNNWALIALVILCWAVVASFSTGYYYYQYTDLSEKLKRLPVHISVSIDYSNGTITAFEDVYLFQNATVLDALRAVTESITSQYWSGWGTIVTSVNGLTNEGLAGWQYWINEEWGVVAADLQILVSGDQVKWKYATFSG